MYDKIHYKLKKKKKNDDGEKKKTHGMFWRWKG